MTPTEQDKELREQIHSALFADDFPILNHIEKDAVDRIVAIIQAQKADRKRVAIETVRPIVEAFTVKGSHPEYHDFQLRRLETEWPSLYFAIKKLEKEASQ